LHWISSPEDGAHGQRRLAVRTAVLEGNGSAGLASVEHHLQTAIHARQGFLAKLLGERRDVPDIFQNLKFCIVGCPSWSTFDEQLSMANNPHFRKAREALQLPFDRVPHPA
jgi:hypothetical protein